MTNSYYVKAANIARNTNARAEPVNQELQSIEEGFDKIPDPEKLHGGSASYATDTGVANAYVVSITGGPASPTAGTHVAFFANATNTEASTLEYGSWAVKAIKLTNAVDLVAGDINAGEPVELRYTGSYWTLTRATNRQLTEAETNASTASGAVTAAASSASAAASSESNAASSATGAAGSATSAAASATSATAAQTAAETAKTAALTAETNSASSASSAGTSATAASGSATSASGSATAASTSAANAATSEANAAASFDSFDDRYLGAKASDPTLDNDGNALIVGALYWNTPGKVFKGWDGAAWSNLDVSTSASGTSYDNATSGLTAEDVQAALDEIAASSGGSQIGDVVGSYAPLASPWLALDGAAYSQATFPDLYTIIGDSYWPYNTASVLTVPSSNITAASYAGCLSLMSDASHIAVGFSAFPYIHIYDWDSGALTKLPNPAALPTGSPNAVKFSPDDSVLAVAHSTSPYVAFYDMSTPASPVKFANPATLPPGTGYDSSWTSDSRYCIIACYHSAGLRIYDFDGGSPVNLASKPESQAIGALRSAQYSPNDDWLVVGGVGSPYITFYDNTTPSDPVPVTDPATMPAGQVTFIRWSPDSRYVLCGRNTGPATVYDMNSGVPVAIIDDGTFSTWYNSGWVSATEFWANVSSVQYYYKIVAGVATRQTSFSKTQLNVNFNSYNTEFSSTVGAVFQSGGTSTYFGYQPEAYDPSTHFSVPNFTPNSDETTGTDLSVPTQYIKGL